MVVYINSNIPQKICILKVVSTHKNEELFSSFVQVTRQTHAHYTQSTPLVNIEVIDLLLVLSRCIPNTKEKREGHPQSAVPIRVLHWGYNSAFLPFFRDFEILGGYSGFNEILLKQLKTRIRKHKINELCVQNEHVYK